MVYPGDFRPYGRRALPPAPVRFWLSLLLLTLVSGCATYSERGAPGMESEAYGVWTGQLPCAGCASLDARLVLWRDPDLFRFSETYRGANGGPKTFTASGRWTVEPVGNNPDLGRLRLTTDDARRTIYLERMPRGDLRLLDHHGDRQEPAEDYLLKRTRARDS